MISINYKQSYLVSTWFLVQKWVLRHNISLATQPNCLFMSNFVLCPVAPMLIKLLTTLMTISNKIKKNSFIC